jgi:hypothetical protein
MVIPKMFIYPEPMYEFYNEINKIAFSGGGTIPLPSLISILNFEDDVEKRINEARGPVLITTIHSELRATNQGKKVTENIPGTGTTIGIIVEEYFSCRFRITKIELRIDVFDITGLKLDLLGPKNPDIRKIIFKLPNHVELIT